MCHVHFIKLLRQFDLYLAEMSCDAYRLILKCIMLKGHQYARLAKEKSQHKSDKTYLTSNSDHYLSNDRD
jgi:hypothetical protein